MVKISGARAPRQEVLSFMTKIDIFSGFLGAGKTTLIKKLIAEAYTGEKIVLIENEFGEIAIDGGFLKDSGVQINEMNSGCICCSLVGDFADALQKVLTQFHPDPRCTLVFTKQAVVLHVYMEPILEVKGMRLWSFIRTPDSSPAKRKTAFTPRWR